MIFQNVIYKTTKLFEVYAELVKSWLSCEEMLGKVTVERNNIKYLMGYFRIST